jgi:ubiquinol-cytochrome c reductase cytochrome b subunit/cytochrome b6
MSKPEALGRQLMRFLKERVPLHIEVFEQLAKEPIPNHMKRWWYALGGTPLVLFGVLLGTGICLTFYYVPEPGRAYDSVRYITERVYFGWYIRSMHKWAANLMVIAVILHLFRVFFTAAYRRPRELNWMIGCGLLFTVLGFGFTGYALVFDELSYWAAQVGTGLAAKTPVVGEFFRRFMLGGEVVGTNTLSRFFVFHIGVWPTVLCVLLAAHIFLFRSLGIADIGAPQMSPAEARDHAAMLRSGRYFPFFPNHAMTELVLALMILIVLTELSVLWPATLGKPANPLNTPAHIQPEWYFFFQFQLLKMFPEKLALGLQLVMVLILVGWPFIDRLILKQWNNPWISPAFGLAGLAVFLALTVREAFHGYVLFHDWWARLLAGL